MRKNIFEIGKNGLGFYISVKDNKDEYLLKDGTIDKHSKKELTYFSHRDNAESAINKYVQSQPMTKQDLKTGMIVEMENGEKRLVIANTLMGLKAGDGGVSMEFVRDDLTLDSVLHGDIVKVYSEPQEEKTDHIGSDISWFMRDGCTEYSRCIWKRATPKDITVAEIEKILGYKIKVVGE